MEKTDSRTGLTVEELLTVWHKPESWPELGYKREFLFNKITKFLYEGGEEAEKAEIFLRNLLDSENPDDRHYSFLIISALEEMEETTFKKWKKAKKDPGNMEFLKETLGEVAKQIADGIV